jgi:hypothetical protein
MSSRPLARARRENRVALALPILVLVLALLVWAVPGSDAQPTGAQLGHRHAASPTQAAPSAQLALHDQMRKLWEDHVTWTRLAIVTFADGSAGFDATAQRLLRNQADLGAVVGSFYGAAAGEGLTRLLTEHITIAVELLQAAKAGDSASIDDARTRWYANADDIADFLSAANPRNWPQELMRADMRAHLDQTLTEATAELGGDHPASVAAYEDIHVHILALADLLTSGLIAQFPSRLH